MKKSTVITVVLCALVAASACKGSTPTSSPEASTLYLPWNIDSLFGTQAAEISSITFRNVSGVLAAGKISGVLTDTSGTVNNYNRSWEYAAFADPIGGGSVVVNSTPLGLFENTYSTAFGNDFVHYDTATVWSDSATNHWTVAGTDSIGSFTAFIDGGYPSFTGSLPVNISTGSDFSFTFNSSNTVNADSAFFIIYTNGGYYTSNTVSANGGTATISATRLVNDSNAYNALSWQNLTAAPVYYGGLIDVIIYSHTIQTFGLKQFAFVKLKETVGVVHFTY